MVLEQKMTWREFEQLCEKLIEKHFPEEDWIVTPQQSRTYSDGQTKRKDIAISERRQGGRGRHYVVDCKHFPTSPLNQNEINTTLDYKRRSRASAAIILVSSSSNCPESFVKSAERQEVIVIKVNTSYLRHLPFVKEFEVLTRRDETEEVLGHEVSSMELPEELRYSQEHEWVLVEEDNLATVGITDYAQDQLGDVVFVELPEPDTQLTQDEPFGVVESVKAVSDIYAPVSGTVKEVNTELLNTPETINEDPYGDAWLVQVEMNDPEELDALMTAEEYDRFIEEEQEDADE